MSTEFFEDDQKSEGFYEVGFLGLGAPHRTAHYPAL